MVKPARLPPQVGIAADLPMRGGAPDFDERFVDVGIR